MAVTGIILLARRRHVVYALREVLLSMLFFPAGHTVRSSSDTKANTASVALMLRLEAVCTVVVIHVAQTTSRAIREIGYMCVHLSAQRAASRATKPYLALIFALAAFLK